VTDAERDPSSIYEMATGSGWTGFDPLRDGAEFEPIVAPEPTTDSPRY
jgi:hypothetical protein